MQEAIVEQTNLKFSVIRQDKRDTAIKTLMDPNTSLKEFSKIYGLPYKITAKLLCTYLDPRSKNNSSSFSI